MPLTFELKSSPALPLDVRNLNPDRVADLPIEHICNVQIGLGNRLVPMSDWFHVSGNSSDGKVEFVGNLEEVHFVGHSLESGTIKINGSVGRHVGASMSGGLIEITGNVCDYAGYEMTGGTIVVRGDAGDHVGGCFPGAKFGMNRGTILVAGSAGKGVGYRMRRGTIVVGGDVAENAAWQMRAGTIIVFGKCEGPPGIDMKRGTILVGNVHRVSRSFVEAPGAPANVLNLLVRWLEGINAEYGLTFPEIQTEEPSRAWCGDSLTGSRGELIEIGYRNV